MRVIPCQINPEIFFDTMPSQILMIFGIQAYIHEKKLHYKL